MGKSQYDLTDISTLDVQVEGSAGRSCQQALDVSLELLNTKLSSNIKNLMAGAVIVIGDGLIESGGQTDAESRRITLDAGKNKLSLQAAEDLLDGVGYLNAGDWTKALPTSKNSEWSCLTYQLVHEFGHLVDGLSEGAMYKRLSMDLNPTKYGSTNTSESFAEAFAYWIFGLELSPEASQVVDKITATTNMRLSEELKVLGG